MDKVKHVDVPSFFMVDERSRVLIVVCCQFSQDPPDGMATEDAVNTIKKRP